MNDESHEIVFRSNGHVGLGKVKKGHNIHDKNNALFARKQTLFLSFELLR